MNSTPEEIINFCKNEWGWLQPPEEIITNAKLQSHKQLDDWRTGDFIRSLNVLSDARINELIDQVVDKPSKEMKFFDCLLSKATKDEKEKLIDCKNRVLAFTLDIQCINEIGNQINVHPAMQEEVIKRECAKLGAVVCVIQDQTPVIVFQEHSSEFVSFTSLSGVAKVQNPIVKYFDGQRLLCALASRPSLILEAMHLAKTDDDSNELESIIKDYELIKSAEKKKLALIHNEGLKLNATDIHIVPEANSQLVKVSVRVYKLIKDLPQEFWLTREEYIEIRNYLTQKSGAVTNGATLRRTGDGRYTYMSESRRIEVRAAFVNKGTETSVAKAQISIRLRIIPQEEGVVNLSEIGVPPKIVKHIRQAMLGEQGLVVMVGPTGAGKSTTMFGMVQCHREIHGDAISRISIEDPIERWVEGIDQLQVCKLPDDDPNKNLFLEYLRTIVRMDPDFVLLGETRDSETAAMAAELATTGHKALTTIHAGNVVEALQRIVNMVDSSNLRQMVIDAMDHLFGQRLVPKLCDCGPVRKVSDTEKSEIFDYFRQLGVDDIEIPEEVRDRNLEGCSKCKGLGVSGVLPSHEVLPMTEEVKALALSGKHADFSKIKRLRVCTLEQATLEHVKALLTPLSSLYTSS